MENTSELATELQSAGDTSPDTLRGGDEPVTYSNQMGTGAATTLPPTAATEPGNVNGKPARTGAMKDVRFHIFVIDTGWNSAASKVLSQHLNMISDLNIDDEVYVLDRATSIALLRHYPLQVGRDPIIAVHDLHPHHRHRVKHTHGFRMHLGILDTEQQVLSALQMFARFLVTHRDAKDIDSLVRNDLHRQGLAGAIEIMGGHVHQKLISE